MGMIAFQLQLADSADLLCRVVGLLAQRDLDVAALESRPSANNGLHLRIEVRELDLVSARIVAAKMARCIGVDWAQIEGDPLVIHPAPEPWPVAPIRARAA